MHQAVVECKGRPPAGCAVLLGGRHTDNRMGMLGTMLRFLSLCCHCVRGSGCVGSVVYRRGRASPSNHLLMESPGAHCHQRQVELPPSGTMMEPKLSQAGLFPSVCVVSQMLQVICGLLGMMDGWMVTAGRTKLDP